jgi:hypothetical protein
MMNINIMFCPVILEVVAIFLHVVVMFTLFSSVLC